MNDMVFEDLKKRVNQYMEGQLPGQGLSHIWTTCLIQDLMKVLEMTEMNRLELEVQVKNLKWALSQSQGDFCPDK